MLVLLLISGLGVLNKLKYYCIKQHDITDCGDGAPILFKVAEFYFMGVYNGYVEETRLRGE